MKKLTNAFLALLGILLCSCSVEEEQQNPDLLSEWELMEVLQSTETSAVFEPAKVEETVGFFVDSKVKRSVSWCSKHDYSVAEYSEEENHILLSCEKDPIELPYKIKGDLLFIYPNCMEACALKYRRIDHLR